jgi:hypothetical protein
MTTPTIEHVDLLTLRNLPTGFKMWQVVDEHGVPDILARREDAELLFKNATERYRKNLPSSESGKW